MTLVSPGKPARTRSFWVDADQENVVYDLFECPSNCRSEVTMLHIVNANGNTTVNVFWYIAPQNIPESKSSHPDYSTWISTGYTSRIIGGKNMTTGEYILLTNATLVLQPGDKIQVQPTGNASPHIDALCTVTETFIPVG